MARLIGVSESNMKKELLVEDSTGCIKVIFFQSDTNQVNKGLKKVNLEQTNVYLKIYGTYRVFKDEVALVGVTAMPVTEHNEITNHLLRSFVGQ